MQEKEEELIASLKSNTNIYVHMIVIALTI